MKAKDLRGRNIEEIDESFEESKEEDAVSAAYENISKKLESIRKDSASEDDEPKVKERAEEPELTEWKGPKPPSKEDFSNPIEDEDEPRKTKIRNLEDDSKDEDEEEDDSDDKEDEEEKPKKEWEPDEDDPLDEDIEEEPSKAALEHEREASEEEEMESDNLEIPVRRNEAVSDEADMPEDRDQNARFAVDDPEVEMAPEKPEEPDTLDDLTTHSFKEGRTIKEMGDDDYFIPNLKKSGQREGNLGYNAHPQREGLGESYSPRGNMEGNNDPNNYFSQHQPQAPKRANKFHLLILIIIGVAVIGFTVYVLKGGFGDINIGSSASPSPSPVVEATPEPTPTPTPEPEVDRSEVKVKVLNGTSTTGLAGTVRDKLKELGYDTVAPGNASNSDYTQSEIRVKEGTNSANLVERMKLDLAPDYEATEGDNLSDSASYDVEVIIGTK